ncbi:metal-dependent hydrolase [Thermococcus sp.]
MDPLKHASVPLLAFLAISKSPSLASVAVLVFGAIFPDFDVLFEEHRGYFHSILFLIPLFAVSLYVQNIYLWLFVFGVGMHFFLDFFSGVIPFLYPVRKKGFEVKVSGIVIFESSPRINIKYEILVGYPTKSRGSYVGLSNESLAMALVALIALLFRLKFSSL